MTQDAVVVIEAMALIIVAIGTLEAFLAALRAAVPAPGANRRLEKVYVRYGRWLVAGLTFQLAADVIRTSIAPSWPEIGQLGAVAALRTFLNFFLERDLAEFGGGPGAEVKR